VEFAFFGADFKPTTVKTSFKLIILDNGKYDLIFIFILNLEEFSKQLQTVIEKQLLEDNGYLYFAYPKKNNPKYKEYIDQKNR
jgi:hypothetical protein